MAWDTDETSIFSKPKQDIPIYTAYRHARLNCFIYSCDGIIHRFKKSTFFIAVIVCDGNFNVRVSVYSLDVIKLVNYYFKNKLSYFESQWVLYTPGWPIFGNLLSIFYVKNPWWMWLTICIRSTETTSTYVFDIAKAVIMIRWAHQNYHDQELW